MFMRIYASPAGKGLDERRGRGALAEPLTASPDMHASRVRTPLSLNVGERLVNMTKWDCMHIWAKQGQGNLLRIVR